MTDELRPAATKVDIVNYVLPIVCGLALNDPTEVAGTGWSIGGDWFITAGHSIGHAAQTAWMAVATGDRAAARWRAWPIVEWEIALKRTTSRCFDRLSRHRRLAFDGLGMCWR